MKKSEKSGLDFEIDKITKSIENVVTGDSFQTEISLLGYDELDFVSPEKGWLFDWKQELDSPQKEVYKLTITHNPEIIQGIVSLEIKTDHIFMHLLESAPFNIGKKKMYIGVAGSLVAYACKRSFQLGFDGFVSFVAKSALIEHYKESL